MKKYLALLLFLLWSNSVFADTTTVHFSLTQPTIGNTVSWGVSTNSNWATVDNAMWSSSGGLDVSINTQSSATSISLTNQLASFQSITLTATGQSLILPASNATSSMIVGGTMVVYNAGSNAFSILAQDGTTSILTALSPGQFVRLTLSSGSTANGTFIVEGPYQINGVSGPVSSVSGDLPSFNGTSGNVLQDSGILYTNVAQLNVAEAFTATQSVAPSTITISTATFTPVFNASNTFKIVLNHSACPCTIANPSGTIVPGTDITLEIQQSSGGGDTIGSWGSFFKFSGGTQPTLSTTASNVDLVPCHVSTSTDLFCGFIGNYSP